MAKKNQIKKDVDWKDVFSWKKVLIAVTLIVILSFFSYHFGLIKRTCEDSECFEEAIDRCSPVKYIKLQNLNYYRYSIKGRRGEYCLMEIELRKMAEGTSLEKKEMFEGKAMECKIPLNVLDKVSSDNIENILNYCTGPLKESMYELIIKRLYTLVISNLGDILGEVQSTIIDEI